VTGNVRQLPSEGYLQHTHSTAGAKSKENIYIPSIIYFLPLTHSNNSDFSDSISHAVASVVDMRTKGNLKQSIYS